MIVASLRGEGEVKKGSLLRLGGVVVLAKGGEGEIDGGVGRGGASRPSATRRFLRGVRAASDGHSDYDGDRSGRREFHSLRGSSSGQPFGRLTPRR